MEFTAETLLQYLVDHGCRSCSFEPGVPLAISKGADSVAHPFKTPAADDCRAIARMMLSGGQEEELEEKRRFQMDFGVTKMGRFRLVLELRPSGIAGQFTVLD